MGHSDIVSGVPHMKKPVDRWKTRVRIERAYPAQYRLNSRREKKRAH